MTIGFSSSVLHSLSTRKLILNIFGVFDESWTMVSYTMSVPYWVFYIYNEIKDARSN